MRPSLELEAPPDAEDGRGQGARRPLVDNRTFPIALVFAMLVAGWIGWYSGRSTLLPRSAAPENAPDDPDNPGRTPHGPDGPHGPASVPDPGDQSWPEWAASSCCWMLDELSTWDSQRWCDELAFSYDTKYAALWALPAADRVTHQEAVSWDLYKMVFVPKKQASIDIIKREIEAENFHCVPGDEELPRSQQLRGDVKFLQEFALKREDHVGPTDLAKEMRAFELVLGNALATYEPLRDILMRYFMDFLSQMEAAAPQVKVAEFAKVFPGSCFAGFTTDFKEDTTTAELKSWARQANSRELMTKIYDWVGDFYTSKQWQKTKDKRTCSSHQIRDRILDHRCQIPRYRMPLKKIGLGWLDLQLDSLPFRAKLQWPWTTSLEAMNETYLQPRMVTLDPPLSRDEAEKAKTCPDQAKAGADDERVPWISGKFGYLVEEDSPLWLLSEITGLPTAAGTSGSTFILMSTAETVNMGADELMLMRLVLIGWMIPFQDHTLIEVIQGAARSFEGRSFPKWQSAEAAGDAVPTLDDWKNIHKTLLPDDFKYGGVTLKKLNKHIDEYITKFNDQHGTKVKWPSDQGDGTKWWEHEVFDYVSDSFAKRLSEAPEGMVRGLKVCEPKLPAAAEPKSRLEFEAMGAPENFMRVSL
eukprot:TRINITY_DN2736_c0_g2_i1.p1 TRINITY_DN2736_c0_g2~~TRINITY_DN2736_c0_g2_i1.p1  ORF type:complete len:643 (+),score=101.37 TRINITY_DN2736_c0_g2_i1:76-2004(+)